MKPSLKTVVAILESSIVKTDDVTSGRRDMDPHGRFRGEWDSGNFYVVVVHWRYRNEAKSLIHVQSCYCCCCLLLKRSALSENEGTKWGHNFTSSTRDATSIFCGHQSLAKEVPLLLSYCRVLRSVGPVPGIEPTTSRVEIKVFLSLCRRNHVISLFKWSSPNYINERAFLDTYRVVFYLAWWQMYGILFLLFHTVHSSGLLTQSIWRPSSVTHSQRSCHQRICVRSSNSTPGQWALSQTRRSSDGYYTSTLPGLH